jgi:hypothetical protein
MRTSFLHQRPSGIGTYRSPSEELTRASHANLAVVAPVLVLRRLVPVVLAAIMLTLGGDSDVDQEPRQMPPNRCPESVPQSPAHSHIMDGVTSEHISPCSSGASEARLRRFVGTDIRPDTIRHVEGGTGTLVL